MTDPFDKAVDGEEAARPRRLRSWCVVYCRT
jgi:hypothetical protein